MKNKYLILVIVLFVLSTLGFAKKLAEMPELTKNLWLTIGKKNIYITDGKKCKVHIYSRKNYKHIKSFGNKGEGPGEFIDNPGWVFIRNKKLILFNNREYHFTMDGKLISERTIPRIMSLKPVLNGFAGKKFGLKRKLNRFGNPFLFVNSYNNELKKEKTIYEIIEKNIWIGRKKMDFEYFPIRQSFDVTKDKIVISDPQKGFYFKVFDSKGNELYEINVPYEKKKVTEKLKKIEINALAKEFGKNWKSFKRSVGEFVFPKYVPAYMRAKVFDNKIYVYTFNTKDDLIELITIDLKGKVLGKIFVPRASQYRCSVKDGIYYYLHEGDEVWELHSLQTF